MTEANTSGGVPNNDTSHEGRDDYFMDVDRMVNEGLGGGYITINNGLIDESTTDTMDEKDSVQQGGEKA